ncbi:hypothetical protein [Pseudomonas oryzihabitans]|uniref:Uncharacterized protein n=1 Tax=Pseudomonas oryzihabitans TaxID=47885 RepID=A0A2Z5A7B6_9PSED|nr:hypothetical protein [Pseudomonas oryzihabitans]AXA66738.1 hypothetical protein CE139_13220 [Pseudomonas oryzihabitans]
MNNLMMTDEELRAKSINVGSVSATTPVSPLDQLLGALALQTQAMLDLAESNRQLAESNREMVDYLADQQDEGGDRGDPRFDLAGKPL